MIHWGVDPGSAVIGLAAIGDDGSLLLDVIHGTARPRVTKKNPNPSPLNEYAEAWAVAMQIVGAIANHGLRCDDPAFVAAVEGPAISRFGRQDALAAARQALFCALVVRFRGGADSFRTIQNTTAKKNLAGYSGADKRRMVEAAEKLIAERWPGSSAALRFETGKEREREAMADALGIAIASRGHA